MTSSLFEPGRTCWRTANAARLSVIVDAADHFVALREAMKGAERSIDLVGWDFDLRIEMLPGESDEDGLAPDGLPNRLGDFIRAIVKEKPDLHLHLLKWDGAMLAAIGKQVLPTLWMQWLSSDRIHFQLDSHHPVGACHHSKIAVIDDRVAFCGGIDVTEDRWDTRDHKPDDPRRVQPDGTPFDPWHDASMVLSGEAAEALGDLARMRWEKATGERLPAIETAGTDPWPDSVEVDLTDIEVAIARTAPRYHGDPLVNEIEELYLAIIREAKDHIYLESQYLAAGSLCEALEERLREPAGPEIVVINPRTAESFMEDEAMHSVRSRMIERLNEADRHHDDHGSRFRIYNPVNSAGTPIYVHAKILIADDQVLRIGSSNVDNRSMGFDTECDVAFRARIAGERRYVRELRDGLLAEHLGVSRKKVELALKETGSLRGAIDRLNGEGKGERGLQPIKAEPLDPLERVLADSRIFDPRYRPTPKQRMKHAAKRAAEPYQVEWGVGGLALGGVVTAGLFALAGYGAYRWLTRPDRRPRRSRRLAAPAVYTDGRLRR